VFACRPLAVVQTGKGRADFISPPAVALAGGVLVGADKESINCIDCGERAASVSNILSQTPAFAHLL
jgi:hypothetical protein